MTVLSWWMQDGFSHCHSNFIFWEQLLDLSVLQYHYGGREASPTHTGNHHAVIVALHQVMRRRRAEKDLLNAQEPTGPGSRWKVLKLSWSMIKMSSLCFFSFSRKSDEATVSSASMVVTVVVRWGILHMIETFVFRYFIYQMGTVVVHCYWIYNYLCNRFLRPL